MGLTALVVALASYAHIATPAAAMPPPTPVAGAPEVAREVTWEERAIAAASAGLGSAAGGVIGSGTALVLGAAMSSFNSDAGAVPFVVLPPALSAVGAGFGGRVAGGSPGMWAGAIAGLAGSGTAVVVVELAALNGGQIEASSGLIATVVAPAAAGGACAAAAAAIFAEAPAD